MDEEPWIVAEKEGEENKSRLATILYTAAEALRIVTALAHPVLPESTAKIWTQLGLGEISKFNLGELKWAQLPLGGKLGKVEPVFPRADKTSIERMQQMEQERAAQAASTTSSSATADAATPAPAGEGARADSPQHRLLMARPRLRLRQKQRRLAAARLPPMEKSPSTIS